MKNNIFITGATGMLAGYLHAKAKKKFNSILLHHRKIKINHNYIKINYYKKNEIIKLFLKFRPRLLIHTAGITSVEKCEKNEKITLKVNYEITKNLVYICKKFDVNLIYISSDHLFSGKNVNGYSETSKTNPLNLYGKSKVLSENFIKKNLTKYLIIRTNFFGRGNKFKSSFSDRIINSLKKNKNIRLFEDVYFNPISMYQLSNLIFKLVNLNKTGTFNISTNKRITKYEFGLKIAKYLNLNSKLILRAKIFDMNLILRPKSMYLKNNKLKKIINNNLNINNNIKYI